MTLIENAQLTDTQLTSQLQKPQLLHSTHEEHLSGGHVGDLTVSPLSGKTVLARFHCLVANPHHKVIPALSGTSNSP